MLTTWDGELLMHDGSLDEGGGGIVEGGQQMLSRGIYRISDSISWSVKCRWRGRIQC